MSELTKSTVDFLKAIGDQTRLELLELLIDGEKTSSMIQEKLNRKQSTISQQLKTLNDANIITFEKRGSIKYYRIKNRKFLDLLKGIQSYVIELNKQKLKIFKDFDIYDVLS